MARLLDKDALFVNEGELVLLETTLDADIGCYQMYEGGISFEGLNISDDFPFGEYGETWRVWDLLVVIPTIAELDTMEPW